MIARIIRTNGLIMRGTFTALVAAWLAAVTFAAGADFPPPVAFLAGDSPAPVIDGRLDDPCWGAAENLGPLVNYSDGKPAGERTTFKFLRDGEQLYFGIRGEEKGGTPIGKFTGHDDNLWQEDSYSGQGEGIIR